VTVVPFGVSSLPAEGDRAAGRRAAGVSEDGPLVLFGGIYDWNDPGLLLDAWPYVRRELPKARLLFLASPNPETTPQRVYEETWRRARHIDPGGRSIVFSLWLPYDTRADLYAAADVLISVSSEGLETDLAYRTRLLDAAWGGLPSITVGGGPLARELGAAGAGWSSERGPAALAALVVRILSDPERLAKAGRAGRRFAEQRTWDAVARPLVDWCDRARVDPNRLSFPPEREPLWRRLAGRIRPA
jgi:glycosyltransferase involved in cell wall biosynthesis